MKKKFMFVALISFLGMGAFLTSCEKEDEWCECEGEAYDSYYDEYITAEEDFEPADYDVTTCDDLEKELKKEIRREGYEDISVRCKSID